MHYLELTLRYQLNIVNDDESNFMKALEENSEVSRILPCLVAATTLFPHLKMKKKAIEVARLMKTHCNRNWLSTKLTAQRCYELYSVLPLMNNSQREEIRTLIWSLAIRICQLYEKD